MAQPAMDPTDKAAKEIGLPPRFFLYTLHQVQDILQMSKAGLHKQTWYQGRDVGVQDYDMIKAVNIGPADDPKPQWRIAEPELVRWLRRKGFRIYHRGWQRP